MASTTAPQQLNNNLILKVCIFVTGLSGIVAEYIMATLASYMLGDAVVQWTLVISTMLFAMGVGSRISKVFEKNLLDTFIFIELGLSLLCAISALLTYFLSAYITWTGPLIYSIATAIGLLIGMEIPIATRLNDVFESLRINISTVMEKDYYGALLGGLIFAFIGLPYLGLTYTPIILGGVNLAVAAILFWQHRDLVKNQRLFKVLFLLLPIVLLTLMVSARPIVLFGEQQKYLDKVIFQEQSAYQRIVLTQHKSDYWLYLNGNQQFSTFDEERYHEPLVHPAMIAANQHQSVLVLGGGDGMAVREVLKYPDVKDITLVDLDPAVTRLGMEHPVFIEHNQNALNHPKVAIKNQDALQFLLKAEKKYDVVIIDLPDPKTVELARLYSREFYQLVKKQLAMGGVVVTQATSPFFSPEAFLSILKSMRSAGLSAIAYHNHIPTLGEWGWVLGMNTPNLEHETLKTHLLDQSLGDVDTRYLNQDALISMLHFGKGLFEQLPEIKPSTELDPVIYHYYRDGKWTLY